MMVFGVRAFAESRNLSAGAVNASNAYRNIVRAIEEAYNASLAAKESSEIALNMVRVVLLMVC